MIQENPSKTPVEQQAAPASSGDTTLVHMGPQHPSTHGVINLTLTLEGEVIVKADPQVGYLHRGIEKLAECTPTTGFIPFTDRVDYLAAMFCNQGWCMAVERLAGIQVPRRAANAPKHPANTR